MPYNSPADFPPDEPFPVDAPNDSPLTPGNHGKDCPGNGNHPGYECCCDNCDHFLVCFPEWSDPDYHGETDAPEAQ